MSRWSISGAAAVGAVVVTILLGLLAVVTLAPGSSLGTVGGTARDESAEPFPAASPSSAPAPGVAAEPVVPRAQEQAPEPNTDVTVLPRRCLERGDTLPSRAGACHVASFGPSRPTVVVWGDSHAWQQVPALEAQARRTRTNLVAFLMGACPPMDLRGRDYGGACVQQGEQALDFVATKMRRQRPVKLVLGGFWGLYRGYHRLAQDGWAPDDPHERFLVARSEMFHAGAPRLFRTLARRDVPTAAIAQAPWVTDEAAECADGEEPYACDLPRSTAIPAEVETARWVRGRLATIRLSGYIDTSRFLCNPNFCRAELRGEAVFLDNLHLDPAITPAFVSEYRDLFT